MRAQRAAEKELIKLFKMSYLKLLKKYAPQDIEWQLLPRFIYMSKLWEPKKLNRGSDGHTRVADVRTQTGILT